MSKSEKIVYAVLTALMVGSMLGFVAAANHMNFVFQLAEFALNALSILIGIVIGFAVAAAVFKAVQS